MSKRGRPCKDGKKYVHFSIRMTEEEYEKLSNASETVGRSKSDLAREGIVMSANNALYMHNLNRNDEEIGDESTDFDDYDDYFDDDDFEDDEE